jgi:4-hydroxy-3-polyprenylbenzoate decarboxylase
VDWHLELGAIAREQRVPLLFENITGYPGGRVFTNGLSGMAEVALALGLSPDTGRRKLFLELKRRKSTPIKPVLVPSGPILENVLEENEINLFRFPVPRWNPSDRGRYIGTWHINVTQDPETGARNAGVYRMELLGPRQATVSTSRHSHLGIHADKAHRRGQALEMAVAIGVSEAVMIAAGSGYPYGQDEYDLAGGLQQESIPLVQCRTVGLQVPADSEIVLEGVIEPQGRAQDGPYFDYTGEPNTNHSAFLFEVNRLMFRNDPIFRGGSVGGAGAEDHQLLSVAAVMGLFAFHGSPKREAVQGYFLKRRWFRAFQWAGKVNGTIFRRIGVH